MNDCFFGCFRGAGARRRTRRRNSDVVEKQPGIDYVLFSGKDRHADSRSSCPASVSSLDVRTEISDIRYSSPIVTTSESSLVDVDDAKDDVGKVRICRVNREMKPVSKGNPSIKKGDEQDKRRSSERVTVKRRSVQEEEPIEQVDAENINRPRRSSTVSKVRRVSVVKLPRRLVDVSIRSPNSAPTEMEKLRQSSRRSSVSVIRTSKGRLSEITPIVHSSRRSFDRVSVMKIDRKSSSS